MELPRHAQPVRLALVVMVDDLQPKVGAALRKRCTDIRHVAAPLPAVLAEHDVLHLVVLQPDVGLQPRRPEPAALPSHVGFTRGRLRAAFLDHGTLV